MRLVLIILAAIFAVPLVLGLIGLVLKLTLGLLMPLVSLAVVALVLVFLFGLFRRMLRI